MSSVFSNLAGLISCTSWRVIFFCNPFLIRILLSLLYLSDSIRHGHSEAFPFLHSDLCHDKPFSRIRHPSVGLILEPSLCLFLNNPYSFIHSIIRLALSCSSPGCLRYLHPGSSICSGAVVDISKQQSPNKNADYLIRFRLAAAAEKNCMLWGRDSIRSATKKIEKTQDRGNKQRRDRASWLSNYKISRFTSNFLPHSTQILRRQDRKWVHISSPLFKQVGVPSISLLSLTSLQSLPSLPLFVLLSKKPAAHRSFTSFFISCRVKIKVKRIDFIIRFYCEGKKLATKINNKKRKYVLL